MICRPGNRGWVGRVELDSQDWLVARGFNKSDLLGALSRVVAQKAGLPLGTFELFETASNRPANGGSSVPRAALASTRSPARSSLPPGASDSPNSWIRDLLPGLLGGRNSIAP